MTPKERALRRSIVLFCAVILMVFAAVPSVEAGEQQFYRLGDFGLDSGGAIGDCVIGYRTFGKLNSDKSNVVLFTTWFMGTSADLEGLVGPGKVVDTSKYFVIAADAFGNGLSSSPSNSPIQKGRAFPEFTTGDMVRSQYRLITEKFGLNRVHAIIGISMGGMQAFEWLARYPGFAAKVVPITGTPKPTSYDLLLYRTESLVLEGNKASAGWDPGTRGVIAGFHMVAAHTPARFIKMNDQSAMASNVAAAEKDLDGHDPNDIAWQLKAIMKHDMYAGSGKETVLSRASMSRLLVVLSVQDHMVNPGPAREFALAAKTESLALDTDCGHYVLQCEFERVAAEVSRFLDR